MLGNYLFTAGFKLARNGRPGVIRFHQRASGTAKRVAARRITQQTDDCMREVVRRIGGQKLSARFEGEALGADGC